MVRRNCIIGTPFSIVKFTLNLALLSLRPGLWGPHGIRFTEPDIETASIHTGIRSMGYDGAYQGSYLNRVSKVLSSWGGELGIQDPCGTEP